MTNPSGEKTELWFSAALLPDGWAKDVRMVLADGLIASIDAGVSRPAGISGERTALPGLANLHSHAFQRGMSGRTEFLHASEQDSFWSWRDLLYHFVERGSPDDIEAITAMAYAEMLEGGFTRVGEFHYLHHSPDGTPYEDLSEMSARIAAAASETGIALSLLPVFYAHAGFGGQAPVQGQRRFLNTRASFADLVARAAEHCVPLPGAIVGTAPHSLRAITPEELAEVPSMRADAPIHIHIAEQEKEVAGCLEWSGARPVEWLLDHADISERWCLIHATHTTEEELRGIAATGAVVGLCPVTEANLGDGIFNGPDFLLHGGRFGVGSDSNVSISAADELRMLEYSQRLRFRRRNLVAAKNGGSTGRNLFNRALEGGYQACGVTGGLSPGKPADIVVVDVTDEAQSSLSGDTLLDTWIFRRSNSLVSEVWRHGERLVENGRHVARSRIEETYRKALARIIG